jgi:hypothetical protein
MTAGLDHLMIKLPFTIYVAFNHKQKANGTCILQAAIKDEVES